MGTNRRIINEYITHLEMKEFSHTTTQGPHIKNTQNCNFASCAVWVRNLVSRFKGGTQTEDFWELSVEEDIW